MTLQRFAELHRLSIDHTAPVDTVRLGLQEALAEIERLRTTTPPIPPLETRAGCPHARFVCIDCGRFCPGE